MAYSGEIPCVMAFPKLIEDDNISSFSACGFQSILLLFWDGDGGVS